MKPIILQHAPQRAGWVERGETHPTSFIYNDAVREHYNRFLRENGIRSEEMTPDQARKFVDEVKRSTDPRVRDFNLKIFRRELLY